MHAKRNDPARRHIGSLLVLMGVIAVLSFLTGCGPSAEELEAVDYAPAPNDEWEVSTPEEQGLDPKLVAELYHNAAELETVYSVLVLKTAI